VNSGTGRCLWTQKNGLYGQLVKNLKDYANGYGQFLVRTLWALVRIFANAECNTAVAGFVARRNIRDGPPTEAGVLESMPLLRYSLMLSTQQRPILGLKWEHKGLRNEDADSDLLLSEESFPVELRPPIAYRHDRQRFSEG
jgi:hypothetical protein